MTSFNTNFYVPYYLMKKDVKEYIVRYRRNVGTLLTVISVMLFCVNLYVAIMIYGLEYQPKMLALLVGYVIASLVTTIIGVIYGLRIIRTTPSFKTVDAFLKKYEDNDLIKTHELPYKTQQMFIGFITLILVNAFLPGIFTFAAMFTGVLPTK